MKEMLRMTKILIFVLFFLSLTMCSKQSQSSGTLSKDYSQTISSVSLNGAGASFPYPVYSRWMHEYYQLNKVKINYQSIGSGGGIAQIKAKTVDFGASDAPLKKSVLDKFGLIQFPMIMGGIVVVVNLDSIAQGKLKLSTEVLSDIFLGKITKWNDERIKKDNKQIALPNKNITVVHRSDGSGTTWIFTNYLDKISSNWHKNVGTGKSVNWPVGIGGKGNEGVSSYVQRVKGSIGYVEFAYAVQNKLTFASLQNKEGIFVFPSIKTFQSAAKNADWKNAKGFFMVLTNQPGKESWPITGASFILIHKNQDSFKKAKTMLNYFDWAFKFGKKSAKAIDYVPIPENVVKLIENNWKKAVFVNKKSVWK